MTVCSSRLRCLTSALLVALAACATGGARPSSPLAAPGTSPPSAPATVSLADVRATIDSVVNAPAFANAHWGVLVVDPATHDTLYSRNAGKLFLPASNMKVVTGATALAQLGADYRYRTAFVARGPIRDGVIVGDLAVVGRGDPSVSDHMLGDAMTPLRRIADSLAARGVRRIAGRLVAAGNAFTSPTLGYGWSWDDLEDGYSAAVDELMFNEGFSEIHVYGGRRAGDSVRVVTRPTSSTPALRVRVTTIDRPRPGCGGTAAPTDGCAGDASAPRVSLTDVVARKDSTTDVIEISGAILAGDSAVLEVTHRDPDLAYLAAFGEALRERGIVVDSPPLRTSATDTATAGETLAVLSSPPLAEILPALMKPSQNQIAEALLRTLGLERGGLGGADSGRTVVERQLIAWGAPVDGFVIRDGSGLSRYDYLAPATLVAVLDAMRQSPAFPTFYDALPIAGVDGTLRSRMRGTRAEQNAHAKTGSVANARSLSGYVRTADGAELIFSLLANNWTVPARVVTQAQDTIVAKLAALRRR